VDIINGDPKRTWTASANQRFDGMTVADVVDLCGVRDDGIEHPKLPEKIYDESNSVELADSFDWRDKMGSHCPSISRISDQANCGSCWAFGSVEVMNARACIQSGGSSHIQLSEQYLVSCALGNRGCSGGQPLAAWNYFASSGIPQARTCPYVRTPCNHASAKGNPDYPDCPPDAGTPECTCSGDAPVINSGGSAYTLNGANAIQQELVQKGPVTVIFDVMQDFPSYTSGVYDPAWPPVILGGHAVAIFGYGTDNGTPYWLVKNSWNAGWGEDGWFRIVRGKNAAYIESGISSSQMPVVADVSAALSGNFSFTV